MKGFSVDSYSKSKLSAPPAKAPTEFVPLNTAKQGFAYLNSGRDHYDRKTRSAK